MCILVAELMRALVARIDDRSGVNERAWDEDDADGDDDDDGDDEDDEDEDEDDEEEEEEDDADDDDDDDESTWGIMGEDGQKPSSEFDTQDPNGEAPSSCWLVLLCSAHPWTRGDSAGGLPSGNDQHNYGNSPISMGQLTINGHVQCF